MRILYAILLAFSFPAVAFSQFAIGQSSGADLTYVDFPDVTVCSHGLEGAVLDIDGDQVGDLECFWELGTQDQDCWSRGFKMRLAGGGNFGSLPDNLAQGSNIDAQQPFYYGARIDVIGYCPDYMDSTFIHRIDFSYFGPGNEGLLLFHMDSSALDFAWLRMTSDTAGGNYCVTFKDAARYSPPVSASSSLSESMGFEVFPTVVGEDLWLGHSGSEPRPLHLRYFTSTGQWLGEESVLVPAAASRFALSPPSSASGLVFLELVSEDRRAMVKLLFTE